MVAAGAAIPAVRPATPADPESPHALESPVLHLIPAAATALSSRPARRRRAQDAPRIVLAQEAASLGAFLGHKRRLGCAAFVAPALPRDRRVHWRVRGWRRLGTAASLCVRGWRCLCFPGMASTQERRVPWRVRMASTRVRRSPWRVSGQPTRVCRVPWRVSGRRRLAYTNRT